MKFMKVLVGLFAVFALAGCVGSIQTGDVGLRTNFNGTMDEHIEPPGMYTKFTSHVDEYTMKDIAINLENLTPKAKDNLSLAELDVTVYYHVTTQPAVRALALKRTNQSAEIDSNAHIWAPAYFLVESIAKSEIADAISKHDSLTIHTQRDELANEIQANIQKSLDHSDPDSFAITRVVIRQVKTDPTIEQSIRNVVSKEKELQAATLNVAIAEKNAESVQKTAVTLTDAYLKHEYNQVLMSFSQHGGTVILDGSSSAKILNMNK